MFNLYRRAIASLAFLIALIGCAGTLGAAPVHITGSYTTETGNQERRDFDWRESVAYLDPERKMFIRLMGALETKKVKTAKYYLFERQHPTRWITLGEDVDGSETAITVNDATPCRVGDVLFVPSVGERYLVTAVTDAVTLAVTRAYNGSTASAAAVSGASVYILFQRQAEGATSPGYMTTDYSSVYNYAQIFKRVFGFSRTEMKERKRGPKEWAEQSRLCDDLITEDIEHALLWGKKQLLVSSGEVFRTTGGIDEFISTNRIDLEGGIGYGDIGWLGNMSTRFSPGKKVWMCSRDVRQQIDAAGYPMVTLDQNENILGMKIDKVRTGYGDFMLVTHHGFENGLNDRLLIVDTKHCAIAEFDPIHLEENIQENDRDGVKHQKIGEIGLWCDTEQAHTMCTNASPT